MYSIQLRHPFGLLVSGGTKSGKTTFVKKLLTYVDIMIEKPSENITYYYSEFQNTFGEIQTLVPQIKFVQGLPDDILDTINRLLLNMMDPKVVLNRSSDAFSLMEIGNDPKIEPKVQLSDVVLKVRKVKVDQSISDGVERMLKQTPALYPIRRVECKILTIPANLPNVRQDNIFSGIIPNSFVVGLVHVDATTGEYDKNPYNFQHFGVTSVSLTANGQEIPFKLLTLKYPKDADGKIDPANDTELDFDEAYNTLFSGTGKIYSNAGLDITREDYPGGYALYAFDLTPDMCKGADYFNTVQRGTLTLALTFGTSHKHAIGMVCYGDFENIIRIDGERNAIYDIS